MNSKQTCTLLESWTEYSKLFSGGGDFSGGFPGGGGITQKDPERTPENSEKTSKRTPFYSNRASALDDPS